MSSLIRPDFTVQTRGRHPVPFGDRLDTGQQRIATRFRGAPRTILVLTIC